MNQLTKASSNEEIKAYFNAILKLAKAEEKYPVNLDEVWPLVYERKDSAVKALVRDFIENEDYKLLRRKVEQVSGAKYVDDYLLTLPCLEYFIVKKVRAVFEVYRKVFHKVPEMTRLITATDRMKAATWAAKFLNLNESSKLMIAKRILDPLGLPLPDYVDSKGILESATELLKARNCGMSAQGFNLRAIEKGILREIERNTSKGKKKLFKCITEMGLTYGENQVNPNNPKETQPLWYESKFDELLAVLDISIGRAAV